MPTETTSEEDAPSSVVSSPHSPASVTETVSKRRKLLLKLKDEGDETAGENHEIEAYLSTSLTPEEEEDPLLFWRDNSHRFPSLTQVAKQYLSLTSSSVPVECMFSSVSLVANGKRSSLSTYKLNAIRFIHDNFRLFNNV